MAPVPTRTAWVLLAWGLSLVALCCAPAASIAHYRGTIHADAAAGSTERGLVKTLGDDVELRPDGLYAIPGEDGEPLLTHGPDMLRAMPSGTAAPGFSPGDPERDPACATDHYQHFFYAHAPGAPDRYDEAKAEIQAAVRRINAVLNTASLASGGGTADLRVLCDEAGEVRVDRIVSPASITELMAAVEGSGVGAANANYTIFYDGDAAGACGVASYADDERLAADNTANAGGGYAVAYERCWFTEGPMHEMAHNQGAVQYGAPHSTGTGGHCFEEQDVLCYSPDGGDLNQGLVVNRCENRIQFDCGADDYFDSAPEPGEYLSEHWNLGSPLNLFISFGDRPVEASAAPLRLRHRKAQHDSSAAPGVTRRFWVRVPQRTRRLSITVKSASGYDLDLYVGKSASPGEEGYVCRSAGNSSVERCVVRHPSAGRWYVGVATTSGEAGLPFKVTAEL